MYCVRMARPRGYKQRTFEINSRLKEEYSVVKCALDHENPFQLLVATILSAQCTDVRVNMVTPKLFDAFPTPEDMALATQTQVEQLVSSTGFFRNKAKNIIKTPFVTDYPSKKTLVPATTKKVYEIIMGDTLIQAIVPTAKLKKQMNDNELIFAYWWNGKKYFAVLKKLTVLEPLLGM